MPTRTRPSPSLLLLSLLISLVAAPSAAAAATWTAIGPWGGTVQALVVAPSDSRIVYAGTATAGVWKSSSGGSFWAATAPLGNPDVQALIVDPKNPRLLFAGTDGGGVWASRDGGASWTAASDGLGDRTIVSLALDPRDPAVLDAGSAHGGLWKSTDGGASWRHPGRGLRQGEVRSLAIDPRNPQVVYAAADGGVTNGLFKSTDGGATWAVKSSALAPVAQGYFVIQVALDPAAPDVVYIDLASVGIYRSDDGAETWTQTSLSGFPFALGTGVLYVSSGEKSLDGGTTALPVTLPQEPYPQVLAVDPQDAQSLYVGTSFDGVFHSTDGASSFRRINRGLAATQIQSLAVDGQERSTLYAGVVNLDLEKLPAGRSWSSAGLPEVGTGLVIDPQSPATLYAIDLAAQIAKTVDGGITWEEIRFPPGGCFAIASLAVDPQTPDNLYVVGTEANGRCNFSCYAYRSRDAGATWTCMNALGGGNLIAVDPLHPETVYAASYDRAPWRSDDSGKHWGRAGSGVPGRLFSLVATSPVESGLIFGFAYPGVYASRDGGRTFGKAGRGLPPAIATNLIADPADPRLVYAGYGAYFVGGDPQTIGVFSSSDGGATWSRLGSGLPDALFSGQLALDPVHRILYAGTLGAGVFQIPLPEPR